MNLNLNQQTTHLNDYSASETWMAHCNRLRAVVIRAIEDGDQELLAKLKTQWLSLKAEHKEDRMHTTLRTWTSTAQPGAVEPLEQMRRTALRIGLGWGGLDGEDVIIWRYMEYPP